MERTLDLPRLFAQLRDGARASTIAELSDLPRAAIQQFRDLWLTLPVAGRRRIVNDMVELSELNIALNFRRVLLVALDDPDEQVRERAIQGLWEEEDSVVLRRFLARLRTERVPSVRAALAQALGRFAELDVLGRLRQEESDLLRAALFALLDPREPVDVRRRALESAAVYSDHAVTTAIEDAYWSGDPALRVSALYAMGRSLDRRWIPLLLDELRSEDPERRYEAATACGHLGAEEALDDLITLTADPDRDVQAAAIAALGRIGGTVATNVLRRLARSSDPVVQEAALEALAEATFAADPLRPTPW
ncbi:MAG: HEAT repeat domain-containing protein [Thermomicrobium sp.]|nr:HEAT repeat domain-containing protein [Thermomicrobium sp.]MDW7982389.1 HEAT repeat domain-containing protein [Thermomicrobium sp.]